MVQPLTSEWSLEQVLIEGTLVDEDKEHLLIALSLILRLIVDQNLENLSTTVMYNVYRKEVTNFLPFLDLRFPYHFFLAKLRLKLPYLLVIYHQQFFFLTIRNECVLSCQFFWPMEWNTVRNAIYIGLLSLGSRDLFELLVGFTIDLQCETLRLRVISNGNFSIDLILFLFQSALKWSLFERLNVIRTKSKIM